VACEDTRVTAQLLSHYGLDKPLLAVHAHNENEAAARVCERLAAGEAVAFVSDAGTPGVSDPGARLVAAAVAAGPPRGAAAGAQQRAGGAQRGRRRGRPGLSSSGFPAGQGRRAPGGAAAAWAPTVRRCCSRRRTASRRWLPALAAGGAAARVTVCRELTKQFETVVTLPAGELPAWLAGRCQPQRGEFVLVLHALPRTAAADALPADAEHPGGAAA
jgi:16S rRNA (cytidine1402-2'-O)-methyltransferase